MCWAAEILMVHENYVTIFLWCVDSGIFSTYVAKSYTLLTSEDREIVVRGCKSCDQKRDKIWWGKMSGCEKYNPVEFVCIKNMLFSPADYPQLLVNGLRKSLILYIT